MDIRKYIIDRKRRYTRVAYQYGYVSAEEIIFGLAELAALAKAAGCFDIADILQKKSARLHDLLPKRGTPAFAEFQELI